MTGLRRAGELEEIEANALVDGPAVIAAGSLCYDGPSEAAQVEFQTERVASAVPIISAGPSAGVLAVAPAPEHVIVLCPPLPIAALRRASVIGKDHSQLTLFGLFYRWEPCAGIDISFDGVLSFSSPTSEWLEARRLQKMLQSGNKLAHQRLKASPSGLVHWLASPGLRGEAHFFFQAWSVMYYDRAAYLLSSCDSSVTDFTSPWTVITKAGALLRSGCDAPL